MEKDDDFRVIVTGFAKMLEKIYQDAVERHKKSLSAKSGTSTPTSNTRCHKK